MRYPTKGQKYHVPKGAKGSAQRFVFGRSIDSTVTVTGEVPTWRRERIDTKCEVDKQVKHMSLPKSVATCLRCAMQIDPDRIVSKPRVDKAANSK